MLIILSIYSKNLTSLTAFLKFFYKLKTNKILNLQFHVIQSQKKKKFSFFSVLQSPHVNKKSQEQFESSLHYKALKIYVPHSTRFLAALKRIKTTLFPDIRIEIKCLLADKSSKFLSLNKTNSDKFQVKPLAEKEKNLLNKPIHKLLKLFDTHGEILIKNLSIKSR